MKMSLTLFLRCGLNILFLLDLSSLIILLNTKFIFILYQPIDLTY